MDKYGVWEVVDRHPTKKALTAKWVFTRKIDGETGKPAAYKARSAKTPVIDSVFLRCVIDLSGIGS
jgi:hypothetical protein